MGNFAIINTSPYDQSNEFYIIDQETLIELLSKHYGVLEPQVLKITTYDKIHVAGLLLMKPSLRVCISDLTGKSRGGKGRRLMPVACGG